MHELGITASRKTLMKSTQAELVAQTWAAQCASCEVTMQEGADDGSEPDLVSNSSDDHDESVVDLGSGPQQAPAPAAAQAAAAAARATQQPPKVLSHAVRHMRAKKVAKATPTTPSCSRLSIGSRTGSRGWPSGQPQRAQRAWQRRSRKARRWPVS